MSYIITIFYNDEYDDPQKHDITGGKYLLYDDLQAEPILVRQISKHGFAFNNMTEDGLMKRSGIFIPSHRITSMYWSDTLDEDEKKEH